MTPSIIEALLKAKDSRYLIPIQEDCNGRGFRTYIRRRAVIYRPRWVDQRPLPVRGEVVQVEGVLCVVDRIVSRPPDYIVIDAWTEE